MSPPKKNLYDVVGYWKVPCSTGIHVVEFEHGTTTGKRVIYIDGTEIYRENWMFRLVGPVEFKIGKHECVILIEPFEGFRYSYELYVDGKPLEKFQEKQSKICETWIVNKTKRIVLEKDTLDVWCNGTLLDVTNDFADEGTKIEFRIDDVDAYIETKTSGDRRTGIVHNLYVQGKLITKVKE
ncbi:hypothetical protein SNEBB_010155 [Seison nebaliae]|nr:hypothetical protein SNEBB_010155 [Seison nebaliae]